MSSRDQGNDSESGESDNASYVAQRPSLAALRSQGVQPLIHEAGWHGLNDGSVQRFVARGYSFQSGSDAEPRTIPSSKRDSDTRSMAVTLDSRRSTWESTGSSAYTPSFGSYTTVASVSSVRTADADSIIKQDLLEDVDDALERPTTRSQALVCPYSFLKCFKVSEGLNEWDEHCRWHFRGRLPKNIRCPFQGCRWKADEENGQDAWNSRLEHMQDHPELEPIVSPRSVDSELYKQFWNADVLTNGELKDLRVHGRLNVTAAYITGVPREGRDQRRRHH